MVGQSAYDAAQALLKAAHSEVWFKQAMRNYQIR